MGSRLIACWFAILMIPTTLSAQLNYTTAARSGHAAPGTEDTFRQFANPVINGDGDVAFVANLSSSGFPVPHGLWAGSPDNLLLVAAAGQRAPGTSGDTSFQSVGWPIVLTDAGEVLFYGTVRGSMVSIENDYGIWGGPANDLRLVARRPNQGPVPPVGGGYRLFFANPNRAGLVGFGATLEGAGVDQTNDSAIWAGSFGQVQLLARGGDPAPGLIGEQFDDLSTPVVNSSGSVAFVASLLPQSSSATLTRGIWSGPPQALRPVALEGTAPPGVAGKVLGNLYPPSLNDRGAVAFRADVSFPDGSGRQPGIWAGAATEIRMVALEGAAAPGMPQGTLFANASMLGAPSHEAFQTPILGPDGRVTFAGVTAGPAVDLDDNDGIWSGSSAESLRLLVRESDVAPGKQPGARFRGFNDDEDYFPAFGNPSINNAGQIAFSATTRDAQGNRGSGIWMTDSNGILQAVIQVGQPFQVAAGDVRLVSSFHFNDGRSSEEGMFSAFNDRGELVFAATFADGSEGVFIAADVPEPAGGLCGALLVIAAARRRR
jgi:hypothetical protein